MLFWLACIFGEVMAECKRPTVSVAVKLLEGAAKESGLWQRIGADEVRRTIANGLRHVEEKVLATEENERDRSQNPSPTPNLNGRARSRAAQE